ESIHVIASHNILNEIGPVAARLRIRPFHDTVMVTAAIAIDQLILGMFASKPVHPGELGLLDGDSRVAYGAGTDSELGARSWRRAHVIRNDPGIELHAQPVRHGDRPA